MEASSSDTWLNTSLLCQASQADHPPANPYSIYPPDLLPLHQPGHLGDHIAENEPGACDTFCQPFHQNLGQDFHGSSRLHQQEIPCFPDCQPFPHAVDQPGSRYGKGVETADPASSRKVHKADREKLRRDRLNEQFTELANALDSDRPKNDKATILGDCVQLITDLRSEVKRLKVDSTALLDESRDLTQEKSELREEKTALKNETEQLQCQLQQRIRLLLSWTGIDPSLMIGAAPFPYPLPIPPAASGTPNSQQHPTQTHSQPPLLAPMPYIPVPPPHGPFAMPPGLQAYAMFANRPGSASMSFFPYPPYQIAPVPVGSHSNIERPFAQYPSALHPVPGYAMQSQSQQAACPVTASQSSAQTSEIPCPSMAALIRSNDEPVLVGVPNGAQETVEENQGIASLLPDSRCRADNLPEKSSDGTIPLLQTELRLQSSLSASRDASSQDVQDARSSSPEIKKEKAMRGTESLSLSYPPAQDVVPAFETQNKGSARKASESIHGDKDSPGCQASGVPLEHDPTIRPPAA